MNTKHLDRRTRRVVKRAQHRLARTQSRRPKGSFLHARAEQRYWTLLTLIAAHGVKPYAGWTDIDPADSIGYARGRLTRGLHDLLTRSKVIARPSADFQAKVWRSLFEPDDN